MSDNCVSIQFIDSLHQHPNADRLEIAHILGTQTIVPKGEYTPNQTVVYFPPDMLIDPAKAEVLGVSQYLKHGEWNGQRCKCRIGAARLRGIPSYGFVAPSPFALPVGSDVSKFYHAVKYQPPEPVCQDVAPDHPTFHTYTDIQHYWRYPDRIQPGEPVVMTEKIHGTNARYGLINTGPEEWMFMVGSHRRRLKTGSNIYWDHLHEHGHLALLSYLCDEEHDVILFGEVFGPRIQDMDYGVNKPSFSLFDISVDGQYLDWSEVSQLCAMFTVQTVPVLYEGPFDKLVLEAHTHGPTTFNGVRCKFKGREGVVVKPIEERQDSYGRVILKSVSADYLAR